MADGTLLAAAAACISPLLAAGGLYLTWRKARQDGLQREEDALRRGDVLLWANDSIRELQSLVLVCQLGAEDLDEVCVKEKLTEIMFNTSVLVERGRLFFKNLVIDDFGCEKEPAYRGYRPMVLDQLVAAHLIACGWMAANEDDRLRMQLAADDCKKKFVSLMQEEVGRSRTRARSTAQGGDEIKLSALLAGVDANQLEQARDAAFRRTRSASPSGRSLVFPLAERLFTSAVPGGVPRLRPC